MALSRFVELLIGLIDLLTVWLIGCLFFSSYAPFIDVDDLLPKFPFLKSLNFLKLLLMSSIKEACSTRTHPRLHSGGLIIKNSSTSLH